MRRLVALGAFSLAGALIGACGDDDPGPGAGGTGGRGGSAGSAGNAGTAGNAGSGGITGNGGTSTGGTGGTGTSGTGGTGTSGTGGTGGSDVDPDAGDGGDEPPCTGCVEFRVPLTGNNQNTTFQFSISPPADFTNGSVTYRVRALTIGAQLVIQPFSTDNTQFSFDGQFTQLNAGNGFNNTDDFVNVVYNLADNPPVDVILPDAGGDDGGTPVLSDHDKSQIIALGFQLGSAGAFTTDFENPITFTVLLDSITFTNVAGDPLADRSFADSVEGFVINDGQNVAVQPGSVIIHHPE